MAEAPDIPYSCAPHPKAGRWVAFPCRVAWFTNKLESPIWVADKQRRYLKFDQLHIRKLIHDVSSAVRICSFPHITYSESPMVVDF